MSSQYPPNLRIRLPALILLLEAALILIFGFFVSYDNRSQNLARDYPVFQDVNLMVIFGFAYFLAFLQRYGFSSIGFNLLLAALGVQWAVLVDGFLFHFSAGKIRINLQSILTAIMSITTVLISTGAILGKANLMQLTLMAMVEVTVFTVNRWMAVNLLQIQSHVSVMHVHLFGAYFGLMVSWTLYHSSLSRKAEKERSRAISNMFAVLGTLFLWIFWPSFNSALITEEDKKWTAIYNTYFVMATSTIAAFSFSMATSKNGKLSMAHIQNATLAGGVALGFSASDIQQPWIAMVLGLAAGTISVLGMACLQKRLDPALKIHDTCGVLYTFGLPSLLGGIIHVIVILTNHSNNLSVFGCSALIEVGALSLSLCLSLFSGLLTGLILTCKLWKAPPVTKYFDDQVYWEVGLYFILLRLVQIGIQKVSVT
ncbi:RH-like protein isoform X3 [Pantherophis guttatus]|uniref:RH-like protein isoform X3 n=1 Tax=Pantherophis guttatus TaxID=94885 RepID=A0A6P9BF23_PANGU|nr:RH-like protein isoform X3 [Pantherophis guttatus]